MVALTALAAATGGLIALGAAESVAHRRRLHQIPCRIHVAGTRGKSSVTRLVAAGLRAAGKVTAAKTTGTLPRMILPDGREWPVFRPRGANINEQIRIVATAHGLGAEALVLECMALQPELHWLSEHKMVRATHAIITNARPDHLDVMGPTDADVARCLAGMIPVKGVLVTAEQKHRAILEAAAADRETRIVVVEPEAIDAISASDMSGFSHVEHRENVAVALALLQELGVRRSVALRGMWEATPDPGALTAHEMDFFGRQITFVNAFAANDPDSTTKIWDLAMRDHGAHADKVVAVFNLRADRASRTRQLARDTTFWRGADEIVLVGTGAYHFAREATRVGFSPNRFVYAEDETALEVFERIVELCGHRTLVVGLANIGGIGMELTRLFRNRRRLAS